MNHKLKTIIFKALDLLPNTIGYWIYHKLQEGNSKLTIEDKIKSTENSFNVIKKIVSRYNIPIENKTIVEIGSGWAPILPYLLVYEAKVKKVLTYDTNKHYQKKAIRQLNEIFEVKYAKTNILVSESKLNNNVLYFPNTDVTNEALNEVDLVISRFVLEHVSPKDIEKMHLSFAEKLKKEAYVLHLISPSDHRAYSDKSLSLYDFLKYSQQEWDSIQTKFDYHNRLRLPQYLDILKQKLDIIHIEYSSCEIGSTEHQKFKNIELHDAFNQFTFEELTAGSINVLLKVR